MDKKILRMTQEQLFDHILEKFPEAEYKKGSYILVKGKIPIMLIAHLDTVHKETPKIIIQVGSTISSPQGIGGDDRCGVYALMQIRKTYKPWLLFTCDEEIGGIGAKSFIQDAHFEKVKRANLKMLIEIDRQGVDDAVYYDCNNEDFEKYISEKGFKTNYGSFSDISIIAPELGVAAVNLSSGYYNAHKKTEYINTQHLEKTIRRVESILEEADKLPGYEYVEREYYQKYTSQNYASWYDEKFIEENMFYSGKYRRVFIEVAKDYGASMEDLEYFIEEYGEGIIKYFKDWGYQA
jgi:hypothetical protein